MLLTCVITGRKLNDTQEERVVQRMAQWLFAQGFQKEQIQIHPQWTVPPVAPRKKKVPVDLAVFRSEERTDEDLLLIGECKPPSKITGLDQLRGYLRGAGVQIGLWFDGTDFSYVVNVPDVFKECIQEASPGQRGDFQYAERLGVFIRFRRETLQNDRGPEFSLRKMAKRIGVSPGYLSQIERGKTTPPTDAVLHALAEHLEVSIDDLMIKAGKLPPKIHEAILLRPAVLIPLIESLENAPEDVLTSLLARAREIRDGNW